MIALKIWQQNASSFRRYGNCPGEVTTHSIMCWGTMSLACRAIFIPPILSWIIQVQSLTWMSHTHVNTEHALLWTFPSFPRCLKSLCHCSLSTGVPLHLLTLAFHGSHRSEWTLGADHGIKTGSHSFELTRCALSGHAHMEMPGSCCLKQFFCYGGRNLCCTLSVYYVAAEFCYKYGT